MSTAALSVESNLLTIETHDDIAVVTVDASGGSDQQLQAALLSVSTAISHRDVGAVVITGPKDAFTVGASSSSVSERRQSLRQTAALSATVAQISPPTIGAFRGDVLGSGFGVSLGVDIRLGADGCVYGAPGVPESVDAPSLLRERLVGAIGVTRGREFLSATSQYDTATLADWGYLNDVCPAAEVIDSARAMAESITDHDPEMLSYASRAIDSASPLTTGESGNVSPGGAGNDMPAGPSEFETLQLTEPKPDIALLTIDRRPRLNALTRETLAELDQAIARIRASEPAAVVIEGAGDRAFSIGLDERERESDGADPNAMCDLARCGQRVIAKLATLPMPVVAAIDGFVMGGGLELALGADIRLSGHESTYSFPELTHGLLPAAGGTQRLPAVVGRARAKEMLFTGEEYAASTMADWGVVSTLVDGDPTVSALSVADRLATGERTVVDYRPTPRNTAEWPSADGFIIEQMGFRYAFSNGPTQRPK